jgi:hypothetical protein
MNQLQGSCQSPRASGIVSRCAQGAFASTGPGGDSGPRRSSVRLIHDVKTPARFTELESRPANQRRRLELDDGMTLTDFLRARDCVIGSDIVGQP